MPTKTVSRKPATNTKLKGTAPTAKQGRSAQLFSPRITVHGARKQGKTLEARASLNRVMKVSAMEQPTGPLVLLSTPSSPARNTKFRELFMAAASPGDVRFGSLEILEVPSDPPLAELQDVLLAACESIEHYAEDVPNTAIVCAHLAIAAKGRLLLGIPRPEGKKDFVKGKQNNSDK